MQLIYLIKLSGFPEPRVWVFHLKVGARTENPVFKLIYEQSILLTYAYFPNKDTTIER